MEHLAHAEAGHSFSLGALSPDRRTHCINFLAERFDKLNALEQSLILANLQAIRDKTITRARRAAGDKGARFHAQNRLEGAVNLFKNRSAQLREILFRNLVISSPEALEKVAGLFLDQHKSYLPAILAALNAAYNGEDIGILTSRGNRKGNRELLRAIESFLGFSIPRRNIYFVNDTSRNQRLKERSSAGKKLEVLIDFALGFYRDRHGRIRGLSKTYDLVLFYDDEPKNLDLVNLHARKMGLAKCLRAIDSTKLAVTGLWMSLVDKVERGLKPHLGQNRI
ncbi:MAG: hypothetical protein DCC75_13335, partial [Proteobacteria bacterium]